MKRAAALPVALLLVAALAAALSAAAETVSGTARAVDGDTLVVAGERVRLIGVDAPERRQTCRRHGETWPCGLEARNALRDLVRGRRVTCEVLGRDRWRRALAVCRAGGVDLAAELVRRGWALAWYPKRGVPGPDYTAQQREAEAARRGIWSGRFVDPSRWRRRE